MALLNPYLTFVGNCEEAFNFYKSVFGGEFSFVGKFKDMPADENYSLSAEDAEKIMHIGLPISKETILFGSDTFGEYASKNVVGNNISLSITADSKENADHLFNGLSQEGVVTMPLASTFWGEYFGMVTDQFGINWMIGFKEEQAG